MFYLSSRVIFTMLCGLLFGSDGYFVGLAWSSCALMFFIVSILLSLRISPNIKGKIFVYLIFGRLQKVLIPSKKSYDGKSYDEHYDGI